MFEIRVNGKIFTLWESASVQRSIDENAGKFQFTSSDTMPVSFPVKAGDRVQILVDNVSRVYGYVDRVSASGDSGSHTITVEGRDNTCDLIDSSVPDSIKTVETPISLADFANLVIGAIGAKIPVSSNVTLSAIDDETGITADSGRKCMEYLVAFARKKQVYLIPDGNGGLAIFRPGDFKVSDPILNLQDGLNNNIKSYSVTYDHSNRFNKYKCTTQDNYGYSEEYDDDGVNVFGETLDSEIRVSRYLEYQSEEHMNDEEIGNRAIEELNIRKAQSTEYQCTVQGVKSIGGIMWDIGQLVNVKDEFAGINGQFLIRSIENSIDASSGTQTVLTLAPPEAYQVKIPSEADKRKSRQGDNLQNKEAQSEEPNTALGALRIVNVFAQQQKLTKDPFPGKTGR